MNRIKLDVDSLKTISYFERATGAKVRDCIIGDDNILFIVEENQLMKALGKDARNVKLISNVLNKKIRITEYSKDLGKFIANLIYPMKADEISEQDGIVTIKSSERETKGLIIGRNATNLRRTEGIAQRYFDIKEIKVV